MRSVFDRQSPPHIKDDLELMRHIQLTLLRDFGPMRQTTVVVVAPILFREIRLREASESARNN